jgi:hypothetical protein
MYGLATVIQLTTNRPPNFLEPGLTGNPNPNYDKTGLDAVIGQRQGDQFDRVIGEAPQPPQNWPKQWGKVTENIKNIKPPVKPENQFSQFVTLKGGEYFFSPSLTFLRNLPSLVFPTQEEQPAQVDDATKAPAETA